LFDKEGVEKSADTYLNSLNFDYGSTPYEAGLYIPNAKTADFRRKPHTAVGSDVAVEDALELEHGDHIVALAHVEGAVQHYLVHEQQALESKQPLIIVCEFTNAIPSPNAPWSVQELAAKARVMGFKINQRHDNTNYSDYRYITWSAGLAGAQSKLGLKTEGRIGDVHKDDIGRLLSSTRKLEYSNKYTAGTIGQTYTFDSMLGVYVVTYEHDWWAFIKKKFVYVYTTHYSAPHSQVALKCRMRYSNNYYQRFYHPAAQPLMLHVENGLINLLWE